MFFAYEIILVVPVPKPLSAGVLGVKAEVSVLYHLAEIDKRVSHAAEGCIDAYTRLVCYLLETHFAVEIGRASCRERVC